MRTTVHGRSRARMSFKQAQNSANVAYPWRARDNYYENMGVLALIVVVASAVGQIDALNGLAYVFLAGRVGQTTAHLISSTSRVVMVRAVCFLIQICIQGYWIVRLLFIPAAG